MGCVTKLGASPNTTRKNMILVGNQFGTNFGAPFQNILVKKNRYRNWQLAYRSFNQPNNKQGLFSFQIIDIKLVGA